MKRFTHTLGLPTLLLFLGAFLLTQTASAGEFVPLVGIPNVPSTGNVGLPTYLNAIYFLIIIAGSLIAVIKIAFAGVQWSLSDVVTDKSQAKKDIYGALLGLAILLIPFIVLKTIYPGLISLDVLVKAPGINLDVSSSNNLTTATPPKTYPPGTKIKTCEKEQVLSCGKNWGGACDPDNTISYFDATKCAQECSSIDGGEFYDPGPSSRTTQCSLTKSVVLMTCATMECPPGKSPVAIEGRISYSCECQ